MNNEPAALPEVENPAVEVEARLHQAMMTLLAPMAARQVTAREAYGAMTRVAARIEGDVPTGARLVGLLQRFNAQRPAGVPPIPAGTAGVAQDCVAAYRRSLVRASSAGVANPALPPDMIEGLNHWLERLLELMREEIRRPYEAEAASLRDSLDQQMTGLRQATDAELATARATAKALEEEIRQGQQQQQLLLLQIEALQVRNAEMELGQARSAQEIRDLAARLAVQSMRVEEAERSLGQQAQALDDALSKADEERRQRLLMLDSARVVEQELAREKEKRKAAEVQVRSLEKFLQEEKDRSVQLQSALADIQTRPAAQAAVAERSGSLAQGKIRPARKAAPAPTSLRRKPPR
ncbi:MAG: hypothetical protein RLZZ555_1811 [Pseudomonadota bacterium]|jgi:hypothetical protein